MKTEIYKGYPIKVEIHQDEDKGEPWVEDDGHGIVSEWERRDKAPGERVLYCDGNSRLFYDFAKTMKIAKRDGWGLSEAEKATLTAKLRRQPTTKQILVAAVESDFKYLRAWCADQWHWQGYTTEIKTPSGDIINGHSCWGFDDEKYMLDDATDHARATVDDLIATAAQTLIAEAMP